MKRQPLRRPGAAFTLIEILTVVAIVAMLAALGFAGIRYAQNKARENDTRTFLRDIAKAIQGYYDDKGNYPRAMMDEEETTLDGESWRIGGARMLYQVLSGDGDDAIKGGEKVSTSVQGSSKTDENPDGGKVYMDTVVAPTKEQIQQKKKAQKVESAGESTYFVIDSWRHPLRYQLAEKDKNGQVANKMDMHSSSNYEIWSYGTLKKPSEEEENMAKWITSWGQQY